MNVSDMYDLAVLQSYSTKSQVTEQDFLRYINIVKDDFFSHLITSVKQDYNWDIFTGDTVWWQTEYTFPQLAVSSDGMLKLRELYISYDDKVYSNWMKQYTKAEEISLDMLEKDWNYYQSEQSVDKPIYFIADNSVFIAPTPKESKTDALQLKWIKRIRDYTISTTEAETKIPPTHHQTLVQGVLPFIFKRQAKRQEAMTEEWEYIRKRQEAMRMLWERRQGTHIMRYPQQYETNIFSE